MMMFMMTVSAMLRIMLVSQKTLTLKNPRLFDFGFASFFIPLWYYETKERA
jgi:hypothetical protein